MCFRLNSFGTEHTKHSFLRQRWPAATRSKGCSSNAKLYSNGSKVDARRGTRPPSLVDGCSRVQYFAFASRDSLLSVLHGLVKPQPGEIRVSLDRQPSTSRWLRKLPVSLRAPDSPFRNSCTTWCASSRMQAREIANETERSRAYLRNFSVRLADFLSHPSFPCTFILTLASHFLLSFLLPILRGSSPFASFLFPHSCSSCLLSIDSRLSRFLCPLISLGSFRLFSSRFVAWNVRPYRSTST